MFQSKYMKLLLITMLVFLPFCAQQSLDSNLSEFIIHG
ncbi:hypothetical protein LCGC14_1124890 [marine sediment metagenome]|uniref:Uncharacterized protein n=1 Tax=marine sediment metagenome TaxID=412755 RepID=A0A0F9MQR2_9ZZZZ